MSVAIMVHKESNGADGGTLNPGGTVAIDTFYARKLNTLLVNQSSTLVSFDGTNFTFTLSPGTFRIDVAAVINTAGVLGAIGYSLGLFNITIGQFEVFKGTSEPILGLNGYGADSSPVFVESNRIVRLAGVFSVTSSNKTYQLRHKSGAPGPGSTWGGFTTACGINDQMNGANVNGAASSEFYMVVKLGRES